MQLIEELMNYDHEEEKQRSLWMRTGKWGKVHYQYSSREAPSHLDGKHVLTFRFPSRTPSPSSRRFPPWSTASPQSPARFPAPLCIPPQILLSPPCSLQPKKEKEKRLHFRSENLQEKAKCGGHLRRNRWWRRRFRRRSSISMWVFSENSPAARGRRQWRSRGVWVILHQRRGVWGRKGASSWLSEYISWFGREERNEEKVCLGCNDSVFRAKTESKYRMELHSTLIHNR